MWNLEEGSQMITQIIAGISMVVLAAAGGCGGEGGKAHEATKPVITKSGDYRITDKFHPKITIRKGTPDCEYWVLWDIPNGVAGADAVQLFHKATTNRTWINLNTKYSFTYPDPRSGKTITKRGIRGTTFVTKGCGPWYKL
jgi:hypothetical protein